MRYIGCKTKLLENIEKVIDENVEEADIFCDIFSGTGTVGEYFKNRYSIISNDYLYFSYVIQRAKIANNGTPLFKKFVSKYEISPIEYLMKINLSKCKYSNDRLFIKNNYSDFCGRNYLSANNAEIIDLWRLKIEEWRNENILSDDEYFYLVACVVETVPYYSNISGTYGAFLKTWDRRALKPIELVQITVNNNHGDNVCYNVNSDELIKNISGDILYIDPPYNERQYLPNYHLLETVARYDYPNIKGVTGMREYSSQKSLWCLKKSAVSCLENMIKNANFKHIILSYNTDGIMSVDEIETILKKYALKGSFKLYYVDYNRFKSRTLVNTSKLHELLFYIKKYE